MDELEISGKRYISSKRIAKENKYHSDYIGQLIRGGRIIGTKVGRAWYVEERSFADYLNKENKTYVAPAPSIIEPAQSLSTVVSHGEAGSASASSNSLHNYSAPVAEAEPSVVEEPVEEIEKEEEKFVPITIAIKPEEKIIREEVFIPERPRVVPVQKSRLTYISDSSPLFPAIPKRPAQIQKPVAVEMRETFQPQVKIQVTEAPVRAKKTSLAFKIVGGTAIGVLGIIVLTFAFFSSVGLDSTVVVQQGKPASVSLTQEKTFCFIFGNCQN